MALGESIDQFLDRSRVAIDNALSNAQIQQYLEEYGYSLERIEAGKILYQAALAAQQRQKLEYGDQIGATETLDRAWETARRTYGRFVKIARIALKDDLGAMAQLGLNGRRKETLAGWLFQARQFYNSALGSPNILAAMEEFGISKTKLEAGQAQMQAVEAANLAQEKERGEAQAATKARDIAFDKLGDWLSDFLAIARIALEDDPQLLEMMGVQVAS